MFRFLFISALLFFLGYGIISFFIRHFGRKPDQPINRRQRNANQSTQQPPQEEKRFRKNIGEYVNYEEIKDDEKQ